MITYTTNGSFRYRHVLSVVFLVAISESLSAQSLSVPFSGNPETTGLATTELNACERSVELSLSSGGESTDTLAVQLDTEPGVYDPFVRKLVFNQTVQMVDDCSLTAAGSGLTDRTGPIHRHLYSLCSQRPG